MYCSLSSLANETSRTIREWWLPCINGVFNRISIRGEKYRKVVPDKFENEEACSNVTEIKERKNPCISPISLITLPLPFENDAMYASQLLASLKAAPMRKTSPINVCSNKIIESISNRCHNDMPKLEITMNLRVDTSFSYGYESDSFSSSSLPPSYCRSNSELSYNSLKNICNGKELMNISYSCIDSSIKTEIQECEIESFHNGKEYNLSSIKTDIQQCNIDEMDYTTALVSTCPSISPRLESIKWNGLYTKTPASSPVASLSVIQKPISSNIKHNLYNGMFHTTTAATTVCIDENLQDEIN